MRIPKKRQGARVHVVLGDEAHGRLNWLANTTGQSRGYIIERLILNAAPEEDGAPDAAQS